MVSAMGVGQCTGSKLRKLGSGANEEQNSNAIGHSPWIDLEIRRFRSKVMRLQGVYPVTRSLESLKKCISHSACRATTALRRCVQVLLIACSSDYTIITAFSA
jgi:hypothetical protein